MVGRPDGFPSIKGEAAPSPYGKPEGSNHKDHPCGGPVAVNNAMVNIAYDSDYGRLYDGSL